MNITYPLLAIPGVTSGSAKALAESCYELNESSGGGYFGAGVNRFWHGGVHLSAQNIPIRAVADGEVVAYRMPSQLAEADLKDGKPKRKFSNGFVLIRHKLTTPAGCDILFYSLSMHLKPMSKAETEEDSDPADSPHIFKKTHLVVADSPHGSGMPILDADALEVMGIVPFGTRFSVEDDDLKCERERYRKIRMPPVRKGFVIIDPSEPSNPRPLMKNANGRILTSETALLDDKYEPTGTVIPKKAFIKRIPSDATKDLRYRKAVVLGAPGPVGRVDSWAASSKRVCGDIFVITGPCSLRSDSGDLLGQVQVGSHVQLKGKSVQTFLQPTTGYVLSVNAKAATAKADKHTALVDSAGKRLLVLQPSEDYVLLGERPAAGLALEKQVVWKIEYSDPSLPGGVEGYAFLREDYDSAPLDKGALWLWGTPQMTADWNNKVLGENRQPVATLKADEVFEVADDKQTPPQHWSRTTGWKPVRYVSPSRHGQPERSTDGYCFLGRHTDPVAGSPKTFDLKNFHRKGLRGVIDSPPKTALTHYKGHRAVVQLQTEGRTSLEGSYPWDGEFDGVNIHDRADDASPVQLVLEAGRRLTLKDTAKFQPKERNGQHRWEPDPPAWHELTDGGFILVSGESVTKNAELPHPIEFDKVVALQQPIPIKRGDILGFPGTTDSANDVFHFEIFAGDLRFTDNPAHDVGGPSLVLVDPKASIYSRVSQATSSKPAVKIEKGAVVEVTEKDFSTPGDVYLHLRQLKPNAVGWVSEKAFHSALETQAIDEVSGHYRCTLKASLMLTADCPSRAYELVENSAALQGQAATLPRKNVRGNTWIEIGPSVREEMTDANGKAWVGAKLSSGEILWFDASTTKRLSTGYDWLNWELFQETQAQFTKDGFCDVPTLLKIIGATNVRDSLPKLRRYAFQHPTEWDFQSDSTKNKWERLQQGPWNLKGNAFQGALDYIRAFQWWDEVSGLPSSDSVWHMHPLGFIEHLRGLSRVNAEQLIRIFGESAATRLRAAIVPLCATLDRYDISTPIRIAHFLAQTGAETGAFRATSEEADGSAYEGRKDLGNIYKGDGPTFKGAGLLQLTGRSNYENYERYAKEDVTSSRDKAARLTELRLGFDSAGWFWATHRLNAIADNPGHRPDAEVVARISSIINGGCNGRGVRMHFFKKAKRVLCHDIDDA